MLNFLLRLSKQLLRFNWKLLLSDDVGVATLFDLGFEEFSSSNEELHSSVFFLFNVSLDSLKKYMKHKNGWSANWITTIVIN